MNIPAHTERPVQQKRISILVPCYNEAMVFSVLVRELCSLADELSSKYLVELIFVDDGSQDETWSLITSFAVSDPRVRAVSLSRNFGHQAALTCGYDIAEGDAVISLDADLQDPPRVVLDLIREWENGADIVYAVRTKRLGESAFKRWTATFFYRLFEALSETSAPANSGDFRLMSRRSLLAFRKLREKNRYIRGMVGWMGFRTAKVEYQRRSRAAGKTKYSLSRMVNFATDAIISSTSFPLRLTYIAAFFVTMPILAYVVYTAFLYFFHGKPLTPGWSSLMLGIAAFGLLNLLCLGIMGEYVGRIYNELKNRPLYIIKDVLDSEPRGRLEK